METRTEITPATGAPPAGRAATSLVLAVAGSGGDGVALLGDLLLNIAAEKGLYGMLVQSYGPQIRGGESAVVVRLSTAPVSYEGESTDLLLCFRVPDLSRFRGSIELHDDSIFMLEATDTTEPPEWLGRSRREPFRYPFSTFEMGPKSPASPRT